jgi:hypothetical protein
MFWILLTSHERSLDGLGLWRFLHYTSYVEIHKLCGDYKLAKFQLFSKFLVDLASLMWTFKLRIGECPSNSPFLKNNGAKAPKRYEDILQLKIHPLYLINLINYQSWNKKSLCIVSKVQSIKLFAPCGILKVQREQ